MRALAWPRCRGADGPPVGRRRVVVAHLLLGGVFVLLAAGPVMPASATPPPLTEQDSEPDSEPDSEQARAEVDRLRAEVTRLEVEVAASVEAYNTARHDLHLATLAELESQTRLDAAQRVSVQRRAVAEQRIRALYRTGPGADTALVLLSGRHALDDIPLTLRTTRTLVAADVEVTRSARAAVTTAVTTSEVLLSERAARVAAAARTEDEAAGVATSLARQRALLATADASLLAAVERERRQAEELAIAFAVAASDGGAAGGTAPADTVAFLTGTAAAVDDPAVGRAIAAATTRLGMPYTWGATGPGTFDCSGLTQWAYAQAGVSIPRTSRQQFAGLPLVAAADLQPGDLVFYASSASPSSIHHVGLYVGEGLMVHAPRTGDVVRVAPIDRMPLFGAVRPRAVAT